jgi:thioredoxin reductase
MQIDAVVPGMGCRDELGFVITDTTFETASPGVFAIGAVRSAMVAG